VNSYHRPLSGDLVSLPTFDGRASASDLDLANALGEARRLGLGTLLSVQELSDASGSWADGPVPISPAGQQAFWGRVSASVLHYALLAELLRVDILSLGSDFREAGRTLAEPDAWDAPMRAGRLTRWRKLIQRTRACYTGALTYGARMAQDAGMIAFWGDLDFVGLNVFPEYGKVGVEPRDAYVRRTLGGHLEQGILLANRWNRPLLLLQVGFPSAAGSWPNPDVPRGPAAPEEQERFYRILEEVLAEERVDGDVVRGFWLWNWRVAADGGGPEDHGFTLRGKPVEEILPSLLKQ